MENINIGVCDVFFTPPNGTETYVGLTKGGVDFQYDVKWHEVKVDQFGDTPIDQTLEGETCLAKVPVVETDLSKIEALMPTGKAIRNAEGELVQIGFGSLPGMKMSKKAGLLRLHPTSYGSDTSNDILIWKAANIGGMNLGYKFNDEQVIEANFVGLIDTTKPVGMMLYVIGDSEYVPATPIPRVMTSFYITPSNASVEVGGAIQFKANAIYEGGIYEDVTNDVEWTSSSPTKLAFSETTDGLADGVQAGTATISAELNGQTVTTSVTVTA